MGLFKAQNKEDGTEVKVVVGITGKFHVVFRDTDAEQTIGVTIFNTMVEAITYAQNFYNKAGKISLTL